MVSWLGMWFDRLTQIDLICCCLNIYIKKPHFKCHNPILGSLKIILFFYTKNKKGEKGWKLKNKNKARKQVIWLARTDDERSICINKSVFGNVVAGAFQITFRAKMHANDVFTFFKNHFWHQYIKTIQNIQTILNFSKKKIFKFFGNAAAAAFPNEL